jgi:2-methylisocitrate lyase-like PEP mutase family enzyme
MAAVSEDRASLLSLSPETLCCSCRGKTLPAMLPADAAPRRAAFRSLHESGCFVMPNPWDIGTTRYLGSLGFKALATTSSGFAFSRGLPDTDWAVPRDMMLAHIAEIAAATDLPVNADFESGYAHEPEALAENVRLCVETGVAGLSIEDATGDNANPLYELPLAVERIRAARAAIDATGTGVLLTGRAECFLVGHPDPLKESIRRLEAYATAGADVLYAPDLRSLDDMRAIVAAVSPKPVNVLMSGATDLRVADLAEIGVRRISVGSALARAAWGGFMRAAEAIAREGSFQGYAQNRSFTEINTFFREDVKTRRIEGADRS